LSDGLALFAFLVVLRHPERDASKHSNVSENIRRQIETTGENVYECNPAMTGSIEGHEGKAG
jgi:hypothetical protein